ncbi:hypothetical protein R5R35_013958 [Gryllus longicercus]|uniref:Uncharacterized protein n=1 Tax=Gryllus longicercus TaxID=2509291 RepID=A0AAN9UYM4_9ORTH
MAIIGAPRAAERRAAAEAAEAEVTGASRVPGRLPGPFFAAAPLPTSAASPRRRKKRWRRRRGRPTRRGRGYGRVRAPARRPRRRCVRSHEIRQRPPPPTNLVG